MTKIHSYYKLESGAELPLIDLKGQPYLQVAQRLIWFREVHPTGILKTTMIEHQGEGQDEYAVYKTELYVDTERGPLMIATGHKRESRKDFPDFMEKCETGSIGRALALAGFGTQFCYEDLNEGTRIVDSPVDMPKKATPPVTDVAAAPAEVATPARRPSFRKNVTANGAASTTSDDI